MRVACCENDGVELQTSKVLGPNRKKYVLPVSDLVQRKNNITSRFRKKKQDEVH